MYSEFIQLHNKSVFSGDYLLAAYWVQPKGGVDILDCIAEVLATNTLRVGRLTDPEQSVEQKLPCVYRLERDRNLVFIAYPWKDYNFSEPGNLYDYILGNHFCATQVISGCKLLDVWFPPAFLDEVANNRKTSLSYQGVLESKTILPSSTIDVFRQTEPLYTRALLIRTSNPVTFVHDIELYLQKYAKAGMFIDGVRDRPLLVLSDLTQTLPSLGKQIVGIVDSLMPKGFSGFIIPSDVSSLSIKDTSESFYYSEPQLSLIDRNNRIGISPLVYYKLIRISSLHGTCVLMPAPLNHSPYDQRIGNMAYRLGTNGYFFEQTWGLLPDESADMQQEILFAKNFHDIAFSHVVAHHHFIVNTQALLGSTSPGYFFAQNWRTVLPVVPFYKGRGLDVSVLEKVTGLLQVGIVV
jgi:hypothetical protein